MIQSRRSVLRGLGGIAMVPTFLQSMRAYGATGSTDTILVCILLAGGNDGLNTVIPLTQYKPYVRLRTPAAPPPGLNLAFTQQSLAATSFDADVATPPASASTYAFAPGMDAMRTLYATGKLAVINGVGLPRQELNPLSHSNAQTDQLTGLVNAGVGAQSGWLGNALAGLASGALGPTASLGGQTALINSQSANGLILYAPIDNFGVSQGYSDDYYGLMDAFRRVTAGPTASPTAAYEQAQLHQALSAVGRVRRIAHDQPATRYTIANGLDAQLRDIARLILGGSGIRGFQATQGGYDTHYAQAQTQPALVAQLGQSIAKFYSFLQGRSASSNVVVMTMSDFGRRPYANQDFGTDHGGATTSFVFGDPVQGGVYGNYPSLRHFDSNGNLAMNIDFRNILSDLITAMGGNPAPILGEPWPRLGFI